VATKHANKSFLSRLRGFSLHLSLCVKGRLWIGWIVGFDGFDGFLFLVVVRARNELRSTLSTVVLTPLKANTQIIYGFGYTLLNPTQVILNQLLTQFSFLKTSCQISDLFLKLGVFFDSMKKLTLERATRFAWRG
jgi:hypothetical protein